MCFRSKNLYNEANYMIRQEFIKNGNYINYYNMNFEFKTYENYKLCLANQRIVLCDYLIKTGSHTSAIKDWKKHPDKYLGMLKLPKYLPKDGRFPWMIPNNQLVYDYEKSTIYIRNRLLNDFDWKCRCLGRPIQIRFIPKGTCYVMVIVYEIELPEQPSESKQIAAIDMGVDNLITMSSNIGKKPIIVNGKILKSINQQYNKKRAELQSELKNRNNKNWSKRLDTLTFKRFCRVKNYMHNASSFTVKWCKENHINTLVVGKNDTWKQGKKNMQNFTFIPYEMLLG